MVGTVYVGNLSWNADEDAVGSLFATIGAIESVRIIRDRETGRSKGFAFVAMENAEQAIKDLEGKEISGRPIKLSPARERKDSMMSDSR